MPDHDVRSGTPRLSVTSRRANHTLQVRVAGELDAWTAAWFRAQTETLLTGGNDRIELDLAEVGFCDVHGARELLRLHHYAARRDIELTLAAISQPVRMLLELLGISPWATPPPHGRHPT